MPPTRLLAVSEDSQTTVDWCFKFLRRTTTLYHPQKTKHTMVALKPCAPFVACSTQITPLTTKHLMVALRALSHVAQSLQDCITLCICIVCVYLTRPKSRLRWKTFFFFTRLVVCCQKNAATVRTTRTIGYNAFYTSFLR